MYIKCMVTPVFQSFTEKNRVIFVKYGLLWVFVKYGHLWQNFDYINLKLYKTCEGKKCGTKPAVSQVS